MGRRRLFAILFVFAAFVAVIVQCTEGKKADSRGVAYAGSATCIKCHKSIEENYVHNAHFKTSKMLTGTNAADTLALPPGEFVFNENTKVGIEKRKDGLYQVGYINGNEVKAARIDMVFGSGNSAYTFGFWYGNKLMQQPLNYLPKSHQWVNSPGFPTEQIYFGRPIVARCLECHSSFADKKLVPSDQLNIEEEFVKGSIIAGIDCERCHGPAAQHVDFHTANPGEKKAQYMVRYTDLAVNRRIDVCGVCHSGTALQTFTSTFSFKPGDTLKTLPQYNNYTGEDPDVHGKQTQLLQASACYKLGKAECISCHDVHAAQKPNLELYAKKCISCHQEVKHETLSYQQKAVLTKNCIDCHMPVKESKAIGFQMSNSKKMVPYKVRTHRIAVYADLLKATR